MRLFNQVSKVSQVSFGHLSSSIFVKMLTLDGAILDGKDCVLFFVLFDGEPQILISLLAILFLVTLQSQ